MFDIEMRRHRYGGSTDIGRHYRWLFDLSPCEASPDALAALANAMRDPDPESNAGNNPDVLAGYTYLGQFIAHEITFDPSPLSAARVASVANFRTSSLDLDSIYGLGPELQPHLYFKDGLYFRIGRTVKSYIRPKLPIGRYLDLPRNPEGTAIIGDPRNDANLLVAQFHVALMHLHNHVVDVLGKGAISRHRRFDEAKRIVTWHFQWIVVNRFLPRIVRSDVLERILNEGPRWFPLSTSGGVPLEFAVAGGRFGHSMLRTNYGVNAIFSDGHGGERPARLSELFAQSGKELRAEWPVDWRHFFEPKIKGIPQNLARRPRPKLTEALYNLPEIGSLPLSTLQRGVRLGLPSGQRMAEKMEIEPMSKDEIAQGNDGVTAAEYGLHWETPLWYYLLKEAEQHGMQSVPEKEGEKEHGSGRGYRLGELGSTLVAEVLIGLLLADPDSYLSRDPDWQPDLPHKGRFQVSHLLQFAPDPL